MKWSKEDLDGTECMACNGEGKREVRKGLFRRSTETCSHCYGIGIVGGMSLDQYHAYLGFWMEMEKQKWGSVIKAFTGSSGGMTGARF